MFEVKKGGFSELVVLKSRFLSQVHSVFSREEVTDIVRTLKKEHPGAAHCVWAFTCGHNGEISGLSDDGEPSGTSGRPILDRIKYSGATNIAITVVRYFGGTKLGTGGLSRAYSQAAAHALENALLEERVEFVSFKLEVGYAAYQSFERLAEKHEVSVDATDFGETVSIRGTLPKKNAEAVASALNEVSNGGVKMVFESTSR